MSKMEKADKANHDKEPQTSFEPCKDVAKETSEKQLGQRSKNLDQGSKQIVQGSKPVKRTVLSATYVDVLQVEYDLTAWNGITPINRFLRPIFGGLYWLLSDKITFLQKDGLTLTPYGRGLAADLINEQNLRVYHVGKNGDLDYDELGQDFEVKYLAVTRSPSGNDAYYSYKFNNIEIKGQRQTDLNIQEFLAVVTAEYQEDLQEIKIYQNCKDADISKMPLCLISKNSLTKMRLDYRLQPSGIQDSLVKGITQSFKNLSSLYLGTPMVGLSDQALGFLSRLQLREFNFVWMPPTTLKGVKHLCKINSLESLTISLGQLVWAWRFPSQEAYLAHENQARRERMAEAHKVFQMLQIISRKLHNLKELEIVGNRGLQDDAIQEATRHLSQLKKLKFYAVDFTDEALESIAKNCTQLEEINIGQWPNYGPTEDGLFNYVASRQETLKTVLFFAVDEMWNARLQENLKESFPGMDIQGCLSFDAIEDQILTGHNFENAPPDGCDAGAGGDNSHTDSFVPNPSEEDLIYVQ